MVKIYIGVLNFTKEERSYFIMKSTLYVEHFGKQISKNEVVAKAKAIWQSAGNKIKDISSLELYVKPEEGKVYFVINGDFNGDFAF